MPRDTTSFEENTQCERFAVDSIPLNLYSLANCLSQRNHIPKADGAISRIVALVASDQRLAYLRQNIYQEAARFYSQMGKFELADEYLSRQLAIVKQKGSEVLTDFVKINLLINQGNWAASRHDLITAELKYSQALLLVESQWEPSKEQIELLFAGIARL
jgi:tetratricopeptide (TPR) repeat protein